MSREADYAAAQAAWQLTEVLAIYVRQPLELAYNGQ
jgi:hypothetical protein